MSDYNGARPVRTERDNETKIIVVDGASGSEATEKLSIFTEGTSLTGKHGVLVFGKDEAGDSAPLPITPGGVKVQASFVEPGSRVAQYSTSPTVGVGDEILHNYFVADTMTFIGKRLLVGARGAVKVRFGYSTDGINLTTVKGVYFQDPKENHDHDISWLELLGDGTKRFMVGITNLDAASSDVYSLIQGMLV